VAAGGAADTLAAVRMWDEASQFDRVNRAERQDADRVQALWQSGALLDLGPEPSVGVSEAGPDAGHDWLVGTADVLAAALAAPSPHVRLSRRPTAGQAWEPDRHALIGRVGPTAWFADLAAAADAAVPPAAANAAEDLADSPAPTARLDLRRALPLLPADEGQLAAYAAALTAWHRLEGFCPACGQASAVAVAGAARFCGHCPRELFPRTDPAVIVAVVDDADRLLLAHQRVWGARRYSILAGFVEAGESLEQAVRREVAEEVGVAVGQIRYVASQPWPMPRSLMLGFVAHAPATGLNPDGDEIATAKWFDRAALRAAVDSGELQLPGPASIAFRLISSWLLDG
jgi:NADH pyrophosphatase NudC (nudix superfamily)